jgi:SAM-dependent methyltransferase
MRHSPGPHDETGKVSFDHIYVADDPRPYFRTLRQFDYTIPDLARDHFARLVAAYRRARGVAVPTVLDVGCSYGVNAALLRCDVTLAELYDRYGTAGRDEARDSLVAADRRLVAARTRDEPVRLVGLDSSPTALAYAVDAGFLDDGVAADLEAGELTAGQREQLAGVGLVVSTGCIGYVTEKTLLRILDAVGEPRPWMAHFCLRMFPYDTIAAHLEDLGYETVVVGEPLRQRRFASPREQELVLERLTEHGIAEAGEADGWLYARLHISRPAGEG